MNDASFGEFCICGPLGERSTIHCRSSSGKSPKELSPHEKTVINGLKQLTEMIFKPHFIRDATEVVQQENASEYLSIIKATTCPPSNVDQFLDAAMTKAEKFCAMVVTNLTSEQRPLDKDWHIGQLNAYQSASQTLFTKDESQQSPARDLNKF